MIFQQDNSSCHTAKSSMKWFRDNDIEVLQWQGNSEDLNPIEDLWFRLKRLVGKKRPGIKTQLIEAIIQAWFRVIEKVDLLNLINSMPRRIVRVIEKKGFPTKY